MILTCKAIICKVEDMKDQIDISAKKDKNYKEESDENAEDKKYSNRDKESLQRAHQ